MSLKIEFESKESVAASAKTTSVEHHSMLYEGAWKAWLGQPSRSQKTQDMRPASKSRIQTISQHERLRKI